MPLHYQSGEEIKKDDHVLFHAEPGTIEFVADSLTDPENAWYVREYGGGVMILDRIAGRTFISADHLPEYEDLQFVSRYPAT
jgi:hypothetical protein